MNGLQILWFASKIEQDMSKTFHAMRSDCKALIKTVSDEGAEKDWKVNIELVADIPAFRKNLQNNGFTVEPGEKCPQAEQAVTVRPGEVIDRNILENPIKAEAASAKEQGDQKQLPANEDSGKVTTVAGGAAAKPETNSTTTEGIAAMYTPASIKKLGSKELVAAYNAITGKSIKRFSSHPKGLAATLKALTAKLAKTKVKSKKAAKPKPSVKPRTVRGSAGVAVGRPSVNFNVKLNQKGLSDPQKTSLRGQLKDWLEKRDDRAATIEQINKHFDCEMRGVVRKLEEVKWVQCTKIAD